MNINLSSELSERSVFLQKGISQAARKRKLLQKRLKLSVWKITHPRFVQFSSFPLPPRKLEIPVKLKWSLHPSSQAGSFLTNSPPPPVHYRRVIYLRQRSPSWLLDRPLALPWKVQCLSKRSSSSVRVQEVELARWIPIERRAIKNARGAVSSARERKKRPTTTTTTTTTVGRRKK